MAPGRPLKNAGTTTRIKFGGGFVQRGSATSTVIITATVEFVVLSCSR
jgi:hypothetical protein